MRPEIRTVNIHETNGGVYAKMENLQIYRAAADEVKVLSKYQVDHEMPRNYDIFYIVTKETLLRTKFSKSVSYLGTERGFHLFRMYSKFTTNRDQVFTIAVKESDCTVSEPKSVFDEFAQHSSSYRRLIIEKTSCVVPSRVSE